MPTNESVPNPVNQTADALLSAAEGTVALAKFYNAGGEFHNPDKAREQIDAAVFLLGRADAAIVTAQARELRRPVTVTTELAGADA